MTMGGGGGASELGVGWGGSLCGGFMKLRGGGGRVRGRVVMALGGVRLVTKGEGLHTGWGAG